MQVRSIDDTAAVARLRATHPQAREPETSPEPEQLTTDESFDDEHGPASAEAASGASPS